MFNIISGLDRSEFEPYLVTLSAEPQDSSWKSFESLNISLSSLELNRVEGLFLLRRKIKEKLHEINPDLVHTQGLRADALSATLVKNKPKIATIRNFPQIDYPLAYGPLVGKAMVSWHKNAMRKMTACACVSSAVQDNLQTHCGIDNTFVVRNGVDVSTYYPDQDVRKRIRAEVLSVPEDGKVWIVSGLLSARKDPLSIINAWSHAMPGLEPQYLVFVGDGPLYEECRKRAEQLRNVIVLGRVENVVDYLRASDFYVSASKGEGMPNAALEAMSCGLPVLLSDIEPHKNILTLSQDVGVTYPLGRHRGLVDAFNELLRRDYSAMVEACLSLIQTSFSATVMSQKYQQKYKDLLES